MDGNYNNSLERRLAVADTAILLDLPRRVCLWRVMRRIALGWGRTRLDMGEDCPERFDRGFLLYIWGFRRQHLPLTLERLSRFQGRVIILRTMREITEFVAAFKSVPGQLEGVKYAP